LTLGRYSHVYRGQESEAVAKLPDLSSPSSGQEEIAATGTDQRAARAAHLQRAERPECQGMPSPVTIDKGQDNCDARSEQSIKTCKAKI
ncbi:unnamed protein product, partial [marine sediment metagenome]